MGDNKPSYMMFDPYSQSETKHPPTTSICFNAPIVHCMLIELEGRTRCMEMELA
jgi:hypothetical protein